MASPSVGQRASFPPQNEGDETRTFDLTIVSLYCSDPSPPHKVKVRFVAAWPLQRFPKNGQSGETRPEGHWLTVMDWNPVHDAIAAWAPSRWLTTLARSLRARERYELAEAVRSFRVALRLPSLALQSVFLRG